MPRSEIDLGTFSNCVTKILNYRDNSHRDYAGRQGWFMAGSYYWTLARTAADAVKMQRDETTASGVIPV